MNTDISPAPVFIDALFPERAASRAKMYAIALEKGDHDDHSMTILSVTDDLESGQAWVDKMNATYRSLQQKRHLLAQACLAWRETHPMPEVLSTEMLDVPKPPTDRAATQSEREEKHRINNENLLRSLASREPQRQWSRQEHAFSQAWLAEHLTPEEAALDASSHNNHWSIQPVPWHCC